MRYDCDRWPHAGHFMQVLRNGKNLGVKHLEFAYQENEGGIAMDFV